MFKFLEKRKNQIIFNCLLTFVFKYFRNDSSNSYNAIYYFIINPQIILKHKYYKTFEEIFGSFKEEQLIYIFASVAILLLLFSLFTSFFIQHYVRVFVVDC